MGALVSTIGIFVAACGLSPQEDVAGEQVDLIEVNHFYDDQGRHVFDQVIFYDWAADHGRHQVRAWRLVKNQAQLPQRNWRDGTYFSLWHDGDVLRKVEAPSMRESWTQYDPELVEREYLPKEKRKELRILKTAKKSEPPAATATLRPADPVAPPPSAPSPHAPMLTAPAIPGAPPMR